MEMKSGNKRPVRVCIVVASIDIIGGHAVQAARLLEGLAREPGIEAELLPINPRLPGALGFLQRVKFARTVATTIAYLYLLLRRLQRYDVVHIFAASYFSFLLAPTPAVLIAKLFGKAVLLNYHSGEAEDHLLRWGRTAIPVIRLADRVIVPSGYLVDVFARFGLRAEVVYNTVVMDRFTFRQRRPLRPSLLSNRNLESHYNVACTLRAFALIERRLPAAELIVAGDGSQREALRLLARELGLRNVEFVGPVMPAQMPALYNEADLFINASLIDNMPLSIIEAFACGLAVVTSDAGGIPYIVTDGLNGLVAPSGDHEALARCALSLLEDDDLAARLIKRAAADCEQYTWEAVRTEWLAHYTELAGGDPMGRLRTGKVVDECQRGWNN